MKVDLLNRILLVIAIVLIASNLIASLMTSSDSYAAKRNEYKVVCYVGIGGKQLEALLNQYGREGWELITVDGGSRDLYFKK